MFLIAKAGTWRAESSDAILGAAMWSRSCSLVGCRTGLKVRLGEGVVAAVEGSRRLSSLPTVEGGGGIVCLRMMSIYMRMMGCCDDGGRRIYRSRYNQTNHPPFDVELRADEASRATRLRSDKEGIAGSGYVMVSATQQTRVIGDSREERERDR
jgi:hypothetical protein